MASKITICGICDLRHITKPALVWCSECDEGLCVECKDHHGLSKGTRSHNTVTISDYEKLPSSILEVTNFCSEHNEKFQIYCKKHELPCCRRCVIETHNECKDISALDDVISDVKTSNVFFEIEHMLVEVYQNIQRILEDRRKNLERLKTGRQIIEKEIQQTRISVNAHLDKLQASIMTELYEAEAKERTKISQLLQSLEEKTNEISKYKEHLANIKQHASDLQIFLAIKQMERDVQEKDKFVSTLVKSDKLSQVSLSCKINDCLKKSLDDIKEFGDIIIKTHASDIVVQRTKEKQAQIIVPHVPLESIHNPSCKLEKTVTTNLDNINGCTLLPDGRMVFSGESSVKAFKRDGSEDFEMSVPGTAFGLTYIHSNNTIAVSGMEVNDKNVTIIDVASKTIRENIPVSASYGGIVSRNNTLIYCAGDDGLRMINLADKSVMNIVKSTIHILAYIATFGCKLYYTNFDTDTVTCCDLHGKKQWEFKDESLLTGPLGVSVDKEGNVFVVGYTSHNVVVIPPDGQRHRELLSGMDGLQYPQVVHYDRSSNKLLVANQNNTAFLFNVERL